MPDLEGSILFLEDDAEESRAVSFDRNLQSLLHQPGFKGVRGIVIGRFLKSSDIDRAILTHIIATKPQLKGIPVIANVDFGHTLPMITFPIGGTVRISAKGERAEIIIVKH
jgi:muramoyltetrapeptide carboxypeptidase LdcA involved in peptidoglycan recycling